MRIVRLSGVVALMILGVCVIVLLAAAFLAVRIVLWLLPVIIIAMAVGVLFYVFNRPRRRPAAIDAEFKVK